MTHPLRLARSLTAALLLIVGGVSPLCAQALAHLPAPERFPLATTTGLAPHNTTATPATYAGKRGVRLTVSDDARRSIAQLPINQQAQLDRRALSRRAHRAGALNRPRGARKRLNRVVPNHHNPDAP